MSTERVIVQRGIAEAFTTQLISVVSKLKAGDVTTNSDTKLPPLFTEGSAQNVLNFMNEAREQGAEVLLGDLTRKGAVIQPHLVKGVKPGMALWDRESFGPGTIFPLPQFKWTTVDYFSHIHFLMPVSRRDCSGGYYR